MTNFDSLDSRLSQLVQATLELATSSREQREDLRELVQASREQRESIEGLVESSRQQRQSIERLASVVGSLARNVSDLSIMTRDAVASALWAAQASERSAQIAEHTFDSLRDLIEELRSERNR